ncbi:hypothetical protein Tco_1568129 [Tanacetum coccineum]
MTDKYCPLGEIQKLEIKLWNLKVKGNDVPAYTKRFQELTLICTKFCANETEKIKKYIRGLPDNIYGNVKSSKPKTLDDVGVGQRLRGGKRGFEGVGFVSWYFIWDQRLGWGFEIGCCGVWWWWLVVVGGVVVGGVGVVCGDGVDRGVGGVDCGVVCGFVCGVVCGGVC